MADEVGANISDIVTEFLLNTCRLRPQLTWHARCLAARCCAVLAKTNLIPLTTGSVAEFYIEPVLPLVGDVDVMYHFNDQLAIPRGHPPPTQLPAEFSDYVELFDIVDSHFPGYVYLELRYLLAECSEDDKYTCTECVNNGINDYYSYFHTLTGLGDAIVHGPAMLTPVDGITLLSVDLVPCVRCLSWPPQAADWPTRHRNYSWPNSATVDRVVSNGCDVVAVAHRQCKPCKWMSKNQWRLSFSRAEIVLLNSWMPVQQIIYHMLRFFMKTKRITDSNDNHSEQVMLSNYHIKTLMLWASEIKPTSWWTESLNLVSICVEMLKALSVCLTDTCCRHYFINDCNLLDSGLSVSTVTGEIMTTDVAYLSSWFLHEYVGKCANLHSGYVGRLFADANTITQLHSAVSAVVDFRTNTVLIDSWSAFDYGEFNMQILSARGLTARSFVYYMNELIKKGTSPFPEFVVAFALLHVARKTSRNCFRDCLMDLLSTILGQPNDAARRPKSKQRSSALFLDKAAKLMKVVGLANKLVNTTHLIEIELSKAYLHRALRCKDFDSDSIYCLANVYLAVLYYTTGQYQTAIDHCTLVTRSQDHSQCSSHVVQGELLPKTDDDIDTVLGLAVFYQYVRTAALNQRQRRQYVSAFTTETFAYYFQCRLCRQVTDMSVPRDVMQQYTKSINELHQLFIGDVLAFKSVNGALKQSVNDLPIRSKRGRSAVIESELNTSELVELLQRSAVEHLTTYRQLQARDFGSVVTIVTTDFEALYAYKHGDYQRCLQLSTQNVHTLLYAVHTPHDIATFPEFIPLLDDDIVSLTALTLIVNPKCRDEHANVCVSQLTLSLYLMTQCQLKLRRSVTSLALTLDCIEVAQRRHRINLTLNHLVLKLIERKLVTYMTT